MLLKLGKYPVALWRNTKYLVKATAFSVLFMLQRAVQAPKPVFSASVCRFELPKSASVDLEPLWCVFTMGAGDTFIIIHAWCRPFFIFKSADNEDVTVGNTRPWSCKSKNKTILMLCWQTITEYLNIQSQQPKQLYWKTIEPCPKYNREFNGFNGYRHTRFCMVCMENIIVSTGLWRIRLGVC